MDRAPLTLTFDPLTIEHLGSNMYSRLPNAVAELVANAYDADATCVEVRIGGNVPEQTIAVSDNGHGMSWDDLNEKYLRIGRNRRSEVGQTSEGGRRRVSGKKGLGKLALFGIGSCVEVRTTRAGSTDATVVTLDWDVLRDSREDERNYRPATETETTEPGTHGTCVTVSRLSRKTAISPTDLATSLSRLFHYGPKDLQVVVVGADGRRHPVKAEPNFDGLDIEFEWGVPDDLEGEFVRVLEENGVVGRIVATEKPLRGHSRGVVVYASGRLANEPEFFGASASSHAYAYITGYVEIDRLDDLRPDVIATDRRAVNWDHAEAAPIHEALRRAMTFIGTDHRRKRQEKKDTALKDRVGVDTQEWVDSIRGERRDSVKKILDVVTDPDTDMSSSDRMKMIDGVRDIAPPYADLYWQDLHPWVQDACERLYKAECYHDAVTAAWARYLGVIRDVSGLTLDGRSLIEQTLGTDAWEKHPNTALTLALEDVGGRRPLTALTLKSFENGQRDLSFGVASAFRNPLSHEEAALLDELGIFTYRHALDALGLISLLCRRVEQARKRTADDVAEGG